MIGKFMKLPIAKISLISILTNPVLMLMVLGCNRQLLNHTAIKQPKDPIKGPTAHGRIYDCAANSLYALCQKCDLPISYDQCIELLPPRTQLGNNMLEFKAALLTLDFEVQPLWLTIDELVKIDLPAIILAQPYKTDTEPTCVGHYIVAWPVNREKLELLDFPRQPVVIGRAQWAEYLRHIGTDKIAVLLCRPERPICQSLNSKPHLR